jgi:SAM-dependent methyltransferase
MNANQERENLWGYAKRLRFVRSVIAEAFPGRDAQALSVLDVGCGNGSELALPLVRDGFNLVGVDVDEHSIEHARTLAHGAVNAQFICGRVEELSHAEPFDVVILSEVLEHMNEPRELLKASIERMAEEGIMIITVPNGYGEFEMDSWMFRRLHLQRVVDALARNRSEVLGATDNHESGHVQFFTRRRLGHLFAQCGLNIFREAGGTLLCGPVAGHVLGRSENFINWNARVTDKLPLAFSSSWYFALRRKLPERRGADATRGVEV